MTETPIYALLGIDPDTRLLIATAPKNFGIVDGTMARELGDGVAVAFLKWDGGKDRTIGKLTVPCRVFDAASAVPGNPVRWFQVIAWCRANGYDHIPVWWDGAAEDLNSATMEERLAGEVKEGNRVLARRADNGPWLDITKWVSPTAPVPTEEPSAPAETDAK